MAVNWPSSEKLAGMKFEELGTVLSDAGMSADDIKVLTSKDQRREAVLNMMAKQQADNTNPLPEGDKHKAPPEPKSGAEAAEEAEETVLMEFPRAVNVSDDAGQVVRFSKGVNRVPKHLADHWYLKAHKVTAVEK